MRKGSITIYLSLVLAVLLSLVFAGLNSARLAAGRVVLASGLEQGLYSLFAGYDRELFESYGLLFLNGGFGNPDLQLGQLVQEVSESAEYILCPQKGTFRQGDLLGITLEDSELTGYTLATDNGGAAFRRQVCQTMLARLGAVGVQALTETIQERLNLVQRQEQTNGQIDEEKAQQEYEEQKKIAAEQAESQTAEDTTGETEQNAEAGQPVEVPEDFENPIEVIQKIQKMGILALALPDVTRLSGFSADEKDLLSGRELQKGMGVIAAAETGITDKILLQEYLVEFFPCYTSESPGDGLQYQVEYAIGGRKDDIENLKSVLYRLLAIREASNMVYLMASPARGAEADAMALTIGTILLIPEAAPIISLLLKLCWSFGESILDIRELLSGGKVPLLKDDASWQLSLSNLSKLLEIDHSEQKSGSGLDYQWYLRILLLMESEEKVTNALMDLTEYNMRIYKGRSNFRLDSCIDAAEIKLTAGIQNHSFSITRSYGYDME